MTRGTERVPELHRGDAAPARGARARPARRLPPIRPRSTSPIHPVRCGIQKPAASAVGETVGHGERAVGEREALLGERTVAPDERRHAHDVVAEREPLDSLARAR